MTRTSLGAADKSIVPVLEATRPRSAAELARALREAREYTLSIYAHLDERQQRFPYRATINPARWEVGHIGWFQEFWCQRYSADDPSGHRVPPRVAQADQWWDSRHVPHEIRWELPLPDWDGIREYLALTLEETLERLATSRDGERYFFELALYHEDMHGEALLMTLQTLALPAPPGLLAARDLSSRSAGKPGDAVFEGGPLDVGATRDEAPHRFVFDNEKWAHRVTLRPFAISLSCVTEGEFARFVEAGGYERTPCWSADGLAWLASCGLRHPAHWRRDSRGSWEVREFDRWRPLESDAPVQHVSAFEAEAFCAWIGRRLPTEAEWECAAVERQIPVRGTVWQWTASAFAPYPGFAADPYAEYSSPWFGDHRSLRGGSWATRPRLAHEKFRNFYKPERHDVFVGFRTCVGG